MPVPVNPLDGLPSHWLQPVYGRSLRLQKEFSPSATDSFFTVNTRCERRNAFISASAASKFFTGRRKSFSCMFYSRPLIGARTFLSAPHARARTNADKNVRAPQKNRDRCAGCSFFHLHPFA